jgi:Ca2+-binding RTX toxin-like protein
MPFAVTRGLGLTGGSLAPHLPAAVLADAARPMPGAAAGESILGSPGRDWIRALTGDDRVAGGAGGDVILGGDGDDRLLGGAGSDLLRGQAGDDRLVGGAGRDLLVGGAGEDVFRFDLARHSAPGAPDVIRAGDGARAFEGAGAAAGDRIDLSRIDADASAEGDQAFAFGGTGRGHVWVSDAGRDTVVRANTDDDPAFEFVLIIEDGGVRASAYAAADFVL